MELKHGNGHEEQRSAGLLIVPYGIETFSSNGVEVKQNAFNRTLWN